MLIYFFRLVQHYLSLRDDSTMTKIPPEYSPSGHPRSFSLLFVLFTFVKFVQVWWLWDMAACYSPNIVLGWLAVKAGDTFSYLDCFEHLLSEGSYYFDNGIDKVYAGRMPHYGVFYYCFRFVCNAETAATLQVLLQLGFELLASWWLCCWVAQLSQSKWGFYATLALLSASVYWTNYTIYLSPESLGLSFLIITLYQYYQYKLAPSWLRLAWVGICLAYLVGLKSYMGIFLPVLGLDLLYYYYKNKKPIRTVVKGSILFALPFVLVTALWAGRNKQVTGHAYLLVQPYSGYVTYQNPIYQSYRRLMSTWGGSDEPWNPSTLSSFFFDKYATDYTISQVPTSALFTSDSVLILKQYLANMNDYDSTKQQAIATQIDHYTQSFIDENPMLPLTSRLALIPPFIFHSGSYYLPIKRGHTCYAGHQFVFKIWQSLLYYFLLLVGSLGLLALIWQRKSYIFAFIPIFLLVLFCFIIRNIELRYFAYSFVSFVVGAAYLLATFVEYFIAKQHD